MANKIILKKSSVASKVPLTTDLVYGELALNYADGKLYYKTASNTIAELGGGGTGTPGGSDTQVQFNDGGAFGGSSGFTYNKTTSTATVTNLTVPGTVSLDTNSLAIGTDASITDINTAHTLGVVSQTNSSLGYIKFGTGSALGYNGTNLVYGSNIVLDAGNYTSYAAPIASPTFTGTPAAPTAAVGTNTTQLATTAFVNAEIANDAVLLSGNQTVAGNKTFSGTTALAAGSTINGLVVGYRDIPQNIQNTAYTLTLADAGEMVGKDDATAYTYTIPANSVTAFPIGTAITFFNGNATANITIAINTDTLRLAGTTTTGSRTLAPWGLATAVKIAATVWLINGSGLT